MTTAKPTVWQLAKAGNPTAITALLNRQLYEKGITVQVILKNHCLKILLESSEVPPQQITVQVVWTIINSLKLSVVRSINVYGRIKGKKQPDWQQTFSLELNSQPDSSFDSNCSDATDRVTSLDEDNLESDRVVNYPSANQSVANSSTVKIWHLVTPSHVSIAKSISWRWSIVGFSCLTLVIGISLNQVKEFHFTQPIKFYTPFPMLQSDQSTESAHPVRSASPSSSAFQIALNKAMRAAERTQTAHNREDWQQVSNLWQEAIDHLKKVTLTDAKYALSQQKLIEYQRNFVYAQQQFQRISKPTDLEITKHSIQSLFESSEIRFRFRASTPIDQQPRVMGQSQDGLAMLELIGSATNLTKVTIVVGLPSDNASATALNRSYMLKLLQHIFPTWHQASDWLDESANQLTDGYTGDLIVIRDGKRVKLSAIGNLGTLVLVVEPN